MKQPNLIYILADDLGYGDVNCNDADCRIPTPHIDDLARRGMRFSDAHATSAVCTPSRYSILTGRYAWRSRLKRGIVWPWDAPLIEEGEPTVADVLRQQGYLTACVGKWHLGWDWPTYDGTRPNDILPFGEWCDDERAAFEANIDYAQPIRGGPVDHGFETYFGVDVPNFTPYTWFENDRVTDAPSEQKPETLYGHPGQAVPCWRHEDMIPAFTQRSVDLIETAATEPERPFFLFLSLTSPHSPIAPNDPHIGASGLGPYGDFVCEIDWIVGQVVDAVRRTGGEDNTLIIFTSDNGPELETVDDEGAYARAWRTNHFSMGPLRGVKRDVWEGGHRVPFIACWPGVIPADTTSHALVSLSDLFATCCEIVGTETHETAQDSSSMLSALKGQSGDSNRDSMVLHSAGGRFAYRDGPWLLIDGPTGADYPKAEPTWLKQLRGYKPNIEVGELYNLDEDLAESENLYAEHPEIVQRMMERLNEIVGSNRFGHRVEWEPTSE